MLEHGVRRGLYSGAREALEIILTDRLHLGWRRLNFEPKYEEFRPRTIWSLSNAFTLAFKELDPIPQFKATAKLGEFLEARFSQSFWGGATGRRSIFAAAKLIMLASFTNAS